MHGVFSMCGSLGGAAGLIGLTGSGVAQAAGSGLVGIVMATVGIGVVMSFLFYGSACVSVIAWSLVGSSVYVVISFLWCTALLVSFLMFSHFLGLCNLNLNLSLTASFSSFSS